MRIETDEFGLDYTNEGDLSYYDPLTEYIDLYHKGDFVGYLMVYTDVENEEREYIIINYNMVYLDTLEKIN